MPKERQVAALSTLFGQWAIEGGAKIVNNLDAFTKALNMVGDPAQYTGSMNREFIIKSETSEALDQRMESAMHDNTGSAFYWWLRSPYYDADCEFCCVNSNGSADYANAECSRGVAPGFALA